MAITQKEVGEKLAGLLTQQKVLGERLQSGFERVDSDIQNVQSTFKNDMEVMTANVDKEFEVLRSSFREMRSDVSAHDALVDRDLAEIREWLKGDGTWPTRSNNGNGSP